MSRQSVRNAMSSLLASLTSNDEPLFAAVYPVMPENINQAQTPACYVMLPKVNDKRQGPQRRLNNYSVQIRFWYSAPQQGSSWNATTTNLWVPPTDDPQVVLDNLLDLVDAALRANNSFSGDSPGGNTVPVLQGEPEINITLGEPVLDAGYIVMYGVIETTVTEQTLGV